MTTHRETTVEVQLPEPFGFELWSISSSGTGFSYVRSVFRRPGGADTSYAAHRRRSEWPHSRFADDPAWSSERFLSDGAEVVGFFLAGRDQHEAFARVAQGLLDAVGA